MAVVVPCYRYGRFLADAVDSLRTQQGGPPRIVVVDDGSPDSETLDALDRLDSVDDVEVVRQENAGVCAARNRGLALADRPFVMCLDADDRLASGALRALRAPLEARRDIGFAYGHQRFFGALEGEMRFPPYDPLRLLDRHLIGPTALVRREVMEDTGGYDPAFTHYEDWELWVDALAHGWVGVRVDAVTHEYRRHAGGKLDADRKGYRAFRRQLAAKHFDLYARRSELARRSDLGPVGRATYRWFWGPRPLPTAVESVVTRVLWAA